MLTYMLSLPFLRPKLNEWYSRQQHDPSFVKRFSIPQATVYKIPTVLDGDVLCEVKKPKNWRILRKEHQDFGVDFTDYGQTLYGYSFLGQNKTLMGYPVRNGNPDAELEVKRNKDKSFEISIKSIDYYPDHSTDVEGDLQSRVYWENSSKSPNQKTLADDVHKILKEAYDYASI